MAEATDERELAATANSLLRQRLTVGWPRERSRIFPHDVAPDGALATLPGQSGYFSMRIASSRFAISIA